LSVAHFPDAKDFSSIQSEIKAAYEVVPQPQRGENSGTNGANAMEKKPTTRTILVPNSFSTAINMFNARPFIENSKFVELAQTREALGKKPEPFEFTRNGVTYKVTDSIINIDWCAVSLLS
jgi:hypothetical protein